VFSIIAGGTPSISIFKALGGEAQHAAVGEKPRESLTTIGVLPIWRT